MSYCPTKTRRNAVNFQKDPIPHKKIQDDPTGWGASLSKSFLNILGEHWQLDDQFEDVYISQDRVAKKYGISRRTVSRAVSYFEEMGVMSILYRHNKTCYYKISSFFTPEVRASLSYLFRVFPIALLLSIPSAKAVSEKMSHYVKGNIFNYNPVSSMSRSLSPYMRARDPQKSEQKLNTGPGLDPTRGKVMKHYELRSVKLTFFGQIRLNVFPESVVYEIDRRMMHMKIRPDNPWRYFVSSCKRYCEEKGLDMDWKTMQRLAREHAMPDDGPFVDESFVPSPISNPVSIFKPSKSSRSVKQYDEDKAIQNQETQKREGENACLRIQQKIAQEFALDPIAEKRRQLRMREWGISDQNFAENPQKAVEKLLAPAPQWSYPAKILIAWFTDNMRFISEVFDKQCILIKQILGQSPTAESERIVMEVIASIRERVDAQCTKEIPSPEVQESFI